MKMKQQLTCIVCVLILVLCNYLSAAERTSEIIQAIVLTRHGDRTPFRLLQKDPVNWLNITGVDIGGQLTGLGMKQCYYLGKHLRGRYMNRTSDHYITGISENHYNTEDFLFKSSAENRCIQSSWAISMGMFPNDGLVDDTTGKPGLPHLVRPIDIHSIEPKNDIVIRGSEYCPSIARSYDSKRQTSPKFKKLVNKYQPFMDHMHRVTGDSTAKSFEEFYWFADTVMTQHYHNVLHMPQLAKHIDEIEKLGSLSLMMKRGDRDVVGKHAGGPFMSFVLETMRKRIANENRNKLVHVSGHDSTIIAVFSALRLNQDYEELYTKPLYGSALVFELHKYIDGEQPAKSNGTYFVKILYKNGIHGKFVPYALKSLAQHGCPENCNYNRFVDMVLEDATAGNWCYECSNHEADICVAQHYHTQKRQTLMLMVAAIALGVLLGVTLIMLVFAAVMRQYRVAPSSDYTSPRSQYEEIRTST